MLNGLRHFKKGKYDTNIFICSQKEPSYDRLLKYYEYLKDMGLTSFIPVYLNKEKKYISITFKNDDNFIEHKLYDIIPEFQQIIKNGQTYINVKIVSSKLSEVQSKTEIKILDMDL